MLAWKVLTRERRSWHGDEPPWIEGETREVTGQVVACQRGYHACARPLDALEYVDGTVFALVEVAGEISEEGSKLAAQRLTVLRIVAAERLLHEAACLFAEQALDAEEAAGRAVDKRSRAAVEVKRAWLRGEASDQDLAAARDAAWAAAWDAAWAAARAAGRDAAWAAAWDAARADQNHLLEALLLEAMGLADEWSGS